ncbi:NADH-quinone oxidoreductase subunit NuoE [Larsenimonas suaedae]|uniref:NADH-quinone oxidoreductase subunit E n=2 Tax=Halomonadaceae TaxID=28256 RepID=A0ABU1GYD5_9GAMM|nr:NADH-quinone oxidoreductase subunit NuoE [Larsenimonas suaedae]MCM5705280.1 NADH-quinone oxidoreductase subunit NuoE [Larsenimonas salina]MDR5897061.1 NADH-quinone oxidoreductase subunit NuoE [Larsenimonas suaedae]
MHDEDRHAIEHEMSHYENPRAASIGALKIVQKRHGWVPDGAIYAISDILGIPSSDVEGVATFYSLIFRQPVGRHVILLCDSMTCYIDGYEAVKEALARQLGIQMGQTTEDGRFTLLPVCCLGNCDKGPAMMVDEDIHGPVTPDNVMQLLETYS